MKNLLIFLVVLLFIQVFVTNTVIMPSRAEAVFAARQTVEPSIPIPVEIAPTLEDLTYVTEGAIPVRIVTVPGLKDIANAVAAVNQ